MQVYREALYRGSDSFLIIRDQIYFITLSNHSHTPTGFLISRSSFSLCSSVAFFGMTRGWASFLGRTGFETSLSAAILTTHSVFTSARTDDVISFLPFARVSSFASTETPFFWRPQRDFGVGCLQQNVCLGGPSTSGEENK